RTAPTPRRLCRPRPVSSMPATARSRCGSPPARATAPGPPPPRTARARRRAARLAGRPGAGIHAPLLASLRLGLYELLYLDGSPDYAVVADAVELAKAPGRGGHGLGNALLRRAPRDRAERL